MSTWDTLTSPEHSWPNAGAIVGPYNVGAQAINFPGQAANIDFAQSYAGAFIPFGWLLLMNSSPYALNVAQGVVLKILPAFTADVFRVAMLPNADPVTWTPFTPLAGAPQAGQDTSLYVTWYDEQPSGLYPCAVASAAAYAVPPPAGQGIIVCTSVTRPSGPTQGMQIYELDTGRTLIWQSATTGWTPPWNISWGIGAAGLGPAAGIDFSAIAAAVSLSVPVMLGRRYRMSGSAFGNQITATGSTAMRFRDDLSVDTVFGATNVAAGVNMASGGNALYIPTSTKTATLQLMINSTAGALRVLANACTLIVEDIGPNVSPPP